MRRLAMIVLALVFAVVGVATAPAAFAAPAYEMAVVVPPLGGGPSIFRIAVATGQVMTIGTQLGPTVDPAPLPPGDYHLLVTQTPDQKTYWMFRMDAQSGRVWFLSDDTWTEITAPR